MLRALITIASSLVVLAGCECGTDDGIGGDGGGLLDAAREDGSTPGADGGPECATYQRMCGGACIQVATDPDNCGGCGVVCGAGTACAGGACSGDCLPGMTACDRACVDTMTDSGHCGDCDTECPAGMGCTEGTCVPAVITGPPPAACEGGGPPIVVDFPTGTDRCAGSVAMGTFRWALCSCTDFTSSALLYTDGYDSATEPYVAGGIGGGVGLNGMFASSAPSDVGGALWASSTAGLTTSGDVDVGLELHVGGPLTPGETHVAADAYVDGDIRGTEPVTIDGALHIQTGATIHAGVTSMSRIDEEVVVPAACDCEPGDLLPVVEIVAARETANDNATIGLDAGALDVPTAPVRLDLPCGHFYLDAIRGSQPVTIVAHGHVALYVGGDVQVAGALRFAVEPTGSLDVFIGGTFGGSAALAVGSPAYPALSRFYIGSESGFAISSGSLLGAFFYAPFGPVTTSGDVEVFGGVFAGDFRSAGETRIHYDRAILRAGEDCELPPPPGCGSCLDCGYEACIDGACAPCTDSSQCCAPLVCFEGACIDAPI
jgi:hypothetical protein